MKTKLKPVCGKVDLSDWHLPAIEDALDTYRGAMIDAVKKGAAEALEACIKEEAFACFDWENPDGRLKISLPLSSKEDPEFEIDLDEVVSQYIDLWTIPGSGLVEEEDDIRKVKQLADTFFGFAAKLRRSCKKPV